MAFALTAQTGTYSAFGSGCAGSGGVVTGCLNKNLGQTLRGGTGVATFALAADSGAGIRLVCAVDFYAAASAPQTGNLSLLAADATGAPTATVLGTTQIAWTTTPGWHRGRFATPVIIQPNTKFFIAFDNPGQLPIMTSGPDSVEHWHSGPAWRGPFTTQRWSYNVICCNQVGGAVPAIGNTGVPSISTPFTVKMSSGKASSAALLITGVSNTTWGVIPLPLDLTVAGAPNCNLLVSFDFTLGVATDANGNSSAQIGLPNQTSLIGVQFFQQWAVLDAAANALGLAFSDGGAAKIGA